MIIARYRTILTARLLLEYREHTLFLAQTKKNGGGFTLPGGKIEGFEFAKEALIRETFEEVGIILNKKALKLVHITHRRLKSTTEIIFFFRAKTWTGEPVVKELEKFEKTIWLPNDEPPKKLPAVIKHSMKRIEEDKIYSQFEAAKPKKKQKLGVPIQKEVKKVVKKVASKKV